MLKSHIYDLETDHEGHTTMITVAFDKVAPLKVDYVQLETSTSNKITSFKTNPPPA